MSNSIYDRAEDAAKVVRGRIGGLEPAVGVVLGSGLGGIADRISNSVRIPYSEIPHFPSTSVAGHAGNLVVGDLGGVTVAAFQGRFHYYEGHSLDTVTLPIRVLQRLGSMTLILTSATGGIDAESAPGSIVCLIDHINLIGENPLRGALDERLGSRFPDMTEVYSRRLRELALKAAGAVDLELGFGVYACLPGPSYETPAEIRMLRSVGADLVGMSVAPEAIVARHAEMEIIAFSLVTNVAAGMVDSQINHQEVLEAGAIAVPRLGNLIVRFLEEWKTSMSVHK